jgi:acyltransferase
LGTYLKNWGYLSKELPLRLKLKHLFLSLFVVLFTFNLNTGPFNYELGVVIMAISSYGNPLLFPITAVAGSLFIIFLAKLTPSNKAILFIGQNSLIFLGLNGLFHHFANQRLAIWINKFLASSSLSVFIGCSFVTLVSLGVCIPCIVILNKFIPQLVGKPKTNGPFLKNLV